MTEDLYYDPYGFETDADPYPMWMRLRERGAGLLQREVRVLCRQQLR